MARTVVGEAVVVRERYFWPDVQLNVWFFFMIVTAALELGINAQFTYIQNVMQLGMPWLFPYGIVVGTITLIFILIALVLVSQRRLLPGIMLLLSFMLLVLFMTGLVETGIQYFGAASNIQQQCKVFVSEQKQTGATTNTLAWLQQSNYCSCWAAAFSFWLIGVLFIIWMMIMSLQVSQNTYG